MFCLCSSFIEYFAHDMSYPVRRKHPEAASERDPVNQRIEAPFQGDGFSEQRKVSTTSKRLLPDRSLAAYNRANEQLVHFIVTSFVWL
ncbi:hypothetical protein CesoFtcFv8_010683 [Champsocephalus esox]|uniref:Uncharacterized protein n=1 Tax=Champsocephalus esox TaxID=159716 RepID=A0AAN8H0R6_9TELE|nr:hypothetical protein CesoFtcFv8_010683 [Champsocephalus esox]